MAQIDRWATLAVPTFRDVTFRMTKALVAQHPMSGLFAQSLNWREWPTVAPSWRRVHELCAEASFFLSPEWVECWLATYGEQLNPELLEFRRDGEVVGCCLLVSRTRWVRGIPLRRVYLNCAGEDEADSTCIEYNCLLSIPDCKELVVAGLIEVLRSRSWDEVHLPGLIENSGLYAAVTVLGSLEALECPALYVDFSHLRSAGLDYDGLISAKARRNIRRSLGAYEQRGAPCTVHLAESADEAVTMLGDLARFHQARWTGKGREGAFASQTFVEFHEALIRRTFGSGQTLLFHVRAGDQLIGALYCFLDRGWIRFYQSGFNYALDPRQSPGLVTNYLVIRYCLDHDAFTAFDFLAGDSQYKRALATAAQTLRWVAVRRATIPGLLFRGLRFVKRTYVHRVQKNRR